MIAITILSPAMEAHRAGCADLKSKRHRGFSNDQHENTFEDETLQSALMAADIALAGWFGEQAYQDDATAWTVSTCTLAPCLAKDIRRERIEFGDRGRPILVG